MKGNGVLVLVAVLVSVVVLMFGPSFLGKGKAIAAVLAIWFAIGCMPIW